jgi:SEC-C motif domain protein
MMAGYTVTASNLDTFSREARAMPSPHDCPCGSGRRYDACCRPFHRGDREPPDAEALMRSRYAAFARKDADYLWRTLHPDHEDRQRDQAEVIRQIRASAGALRYMGLTILDRRGPDGEGLAQVLFLARIFEKGQDRSFVELSDFAHDGDGWRYLRGETAPAGRIQGDPARLTIATFSRRG